MRKIYFVVVICCALASYSHGQSNTNLYSLLFDQQDAVNIPYSPSFTNQITMECWFRVLNLPIAEGANLITKDGCLIQFFNSKPTGYFWFGAQYYIPGNTITDFQWHHVALTYDGSQIKLIQDGVLVNTVNIVGTIQNGNSGITFGFAGIPTSQIGNIDEVRIWNRALSPNEILSKMGMVLSPSQETGLVGYWRFEEGTGVLINDLSGNALNGTQNNCTWSSSVPYVTIQAANTLFTKITTNQFTLNWTDGNGSKRAVFIKQDNQGTPSPVSGTTYTANTIFGAGSQIGTSGWYCVFNGTTHPNGVTVTNLQPRTNYRIMVCEYVGNPGFETYNLTTAFNNPVTQSTFYLTGAISQLTSAPKPYCLWLASSAEFAPLSWSTGESSTRIQVCNTGNYVCNHSSSTDTIGVFVSEFNDSLYTPNGKVFAVIRKGDTVYLGGQFDYVARPTGTGAHFQWPRDFNTTYMPRVNGPIDLVVPDGVGGWYIAGDFTKVGVDSVRYLAHIQSDKKLDTTFRPNPNGNVRAICITGNRMFVGGSFTRMGDVNRGYLLMLDKITGAATSWDPLINGHVGGLALSGDKLYVGGSFTSLGTMARQNLGAVDTTFAMATTWNPSPNARVTKLVLEGIKLYVIGDFTNISGSSRSRLASYTLLTGNLDTWSPNPNNKVYDLVVSSNTIYVAGKFTSVGGSVRNFLAGLNNTNGNTTTWWPGVNDTVHSLGILNGFLYAGGRFTTVNTSGSPVNRLKACAFNLSDGQVTAWAPDFTGTTGENAKINAIGSQGNSIYMGGDFMGLKCIARPNAAAINALTGVPTGFNPMPNGRVRTILIEGTNIYLGGDFTTIWNGTANIPRNRIARIGENGTLSTWNPNADGSVCALALKGQYLYAGGSFLNIGSNPRPRLGAIKISDGTSSTWTPNPNDTVKSLIIGGDTLFVGGDFTSTAGGTRNRIAAYNLNTMNLTGFDPNPNGEVNAMAIRNKMLYIGGSFTTIGGQPRQGFANYQVTTNTLQNLQMTLSGASANSIHALCTGDSAIYSGGLFAFQNNALTSCKNSMAFKLGKSVQTKQWHPDPNGLVRAMFLYKNRMYLGGDFTESLNNSQPFFTEVDNFCTVDNYLPEPSDTNFCQGDSIPLVAAAGQGFKYQWYKDDVLIPGATHRWHVPLLTGWYKVLITDSINYGSLFTNARHVTVYNLASPVITPSGPLNFCGSVGQQVILSAAAGTGFAYQWFRNGTPIPDAYQSSLTVTSSGNYHCIIYNSVGCPAESEHKQINADYIAPVLLVIGSLPKCPETEITLASSLSAGYFHQWYKDGVIISGAAGSSIQVIQAGIYKVRDSIGTCANFSNDTAVTIIAMPDAAGSISGSSNVVPGQTGVSYQVGPVANATGYTWSLPAGATITSGNNTNSILVSFSQSATSGIIKVSGNNECGSGNWSPDFLITVGPPIPANLNITNAIVATGQVVCYDATQVITVAGNGTIYFVLAGGDATFIAGQRISFLPGVTVQSGGNLNAYITTNSNYCSALSPGIPGRSVVSSESLENSQGSPPFRIFPNPTNGNFMIELSNGMVSQKTVIQIYGMMGELVLSKESYEQSRIEISLGTKPSGIYVLRILADGITGFGKVMVVK